jgi:acid stress-induced BolA-like protein IbaG/YrbA
MSISTTEINSLLTAVFTDARIEVQGADGKYQVQVVSSAFTGLNRVKRQQAVYRVLNTHIASGAIHAVSMMLQTPEELTSGS